MTALKAPPIFHWRKIQWEKIVEQVRRLQTRIAKAWKQGKYLMVKHLQKLLQKSFYAKLLAVKRVTSNKGKNTPGVDKELWKSPEIKLRKAYQLGKDIYTPKPLRRIYIPKKNGKMRTLGIPTMTDRAMQALQLLTLEPISESMGDRHSYGFRNSRSCADAIEQCFTVLARKISAQYVLEGDIKACFDEISHEWMLKHIPIDKEMLRKMLKAGFMEKNTFHKTDLGTPQGGIVSPTLANMVLDGIENFLLNQFGRKLKIHKVHVIRYADDFIITADSKEMLENEIKPKLVTFFQERGLQLSNEKTVISHIQQGFNFLGQTIRKFENKLIIKPSNKSVKAILDKIQDICHKNKQVKTGELIDLINPIIRGWTNYHRHVVSSDTFSKIDHKIFRIIWKWAKRRHPNKTKKWVCRNYYTSLRGDNWTFFAEENGMKRYLLRASNTKIKRHIKIKQDANPFDPAWERYFENRERHKLLGKYTGKIQANTILKQQNKICTKCHEKITNNEWEYHFKQSWIYGGSTKNTNLVIVHPNCHEQLHRAENEQVRVLNGAL